MMTDERARGQQSGWAKVGSFLVDRRGEDCAVGGPSLAVFSWANRVGGGRHNESKIMNR